LKTAFLGMFVMAAAENLSNEGVCPFGKNGVIAMTAAKRKPGGHNIQIRFGQLKIEK
jgi:hypothetical protein